jgi:hypothetical protein
MNRFHQIAVRVVLVLLTCAAVGSANDQQTQPEFWTSDDEFARVARAEVPGFAGFYLDDDGTPVILLKDMKQRHAAELYLTAELENIFETTGYRAPIFRKVPHDFADLKGWFNKLNAALMTPSRRDVYSLDVDEVQNRVFVGVRDEAAIRSVRREAARLGVPPGKIRVEIRGRDRMLIGLRERTSYLAGGYMISASTAGGYGGGCTLGFNATHLGISVFVTNSHCTHTYLAYDGGTHTQPTYFAGNEIGTELVDRTLYNCNAGETLTCRQSDAAYIQHNGSRTIGQGKIAYTQAASGGPAPTTVLGYYDIIRRYTGSAPTGGLTNLYKTGMITGTTYGKVTTSCTTRQDYDANGKWHKFVCQDLSSVYAENGDSGSPMYLLVSTPEGVKVELYGILWGHASTGETISSRLPGIEADLGPLLNLCAPGYGC